MPGSGSRRSSPATSSSSAAVAPCRSLPKWGTRASTSVTGGSSTRREPESRFSRSRAGTRRRSPGPEARYEKRGSSRRGSDRAGEGVALRRLAGLVALREPPPALLGRAVRPCLGVDLSLRPLLDAVVSDCTGGVDPAVDVRLGQVFDQAGLDGVARPDACVAVG